MKHHDGSTHLGAIKHPTNTFRPLGAKLKKPAAHRPCVRHSQVSAMERHGISEPNIVSHDARWHGQYFTAYFFVVVGNRPVHWVGILAYLLIFDVGWGCWRALV